MNGVRARLTVGVTIVIASILTALGPPLAVAPAQAAVTSTVLFADNFARPAGGLVGNGWTEVETGSAGNNLEIEGSRLDVDSDDGVFLPRAQRTFAPLSSGVIAWSFVFNWAEQTEDNYELFMQLGDSAALADPVSNPSAGVGVDLRWSGTTTPQATSELFGYVQAGTRTTIERVSGEVTVRVVADLDAGTYDVDIDPGDGTVEATGVQLGSDRLDSIRLMTNGLNSSRVTGHSFDAMSVAQADPVALFADPFARPDAAALGNGWTEVETGSTSNRVRLAASRLDVSSADGTFSPRALHTFAPQSSGVLAWSYTFDWDQTATENTYDLYIQLGDSALLADPAVNPGTGVGVDLRWSGSATPGSSGAESFGYVAAGTRTEIERAGGEITVRVVADLDAGTYDIDIDIDDGVVEASGVNLGTDRLDTVRLMTDKLNTAKFATHRFDDLSVDSLAVGADTAAPPFPIPVEVPRPAAGEVVVENGPPGFRAVIQSAGGIRAGDVTVTRDRTVGGGATADLLASAAFAIDLPADSAPINSARLTLPYQPQLLDGYPEADLRVHRLHEESGLWVPTTTGQMIDQAANTISVDVSTFSTYAVFKVRDAAAWEAYFDNVPVQCVGAQVQVDAALVLDVSGSMATNDLNALRVPAARRFVTNMRDTDRAGVITFNTSSVVRRPLTLLDTAEQRALVNTAIGAGSAASGNTNLSSAVSAATTMLAGSPSTQSLRAVVLLTDGVSAYNTTLTSNAAAVGITIYTIGLGPGVDAPQLTAMAEGTGGRYVSLMDPAQLDEVYADLVDDLIDDGTDTDGDGLSDCVETNGAFVPGLLNAGPLGATPALDGFVVTNPSKPDTDDDDLDDLERDADGDGQISADELGELRGPYTISSDSNTVLKTTYAFLTDAGLDTYYGLRSDPRKPDTDGDNVSDAVEVRINGSDPRRAETDSFGVPGLVLPLNTMFQPSELTPDDAPRPFFTGYVLRNGGNPVPARVAPLVLSYDSNGDCDPARSGIGFCDALLAAAQAQPDTPFYACWFPAPCADDTSQMRDIISQIRSTQGFYDDDRQIAGPFAQDQAAYTCLAWTGSSGCQTAAESVGSTVPAQFGTVISGVARTAAPASRGGVTIRPALAQALADTVSVSVSISAGVLLGEALDDEISTAYAACYAGPVLREYKWITLYQHPCNGQAIFMPAGDMREASQHDLDAIGAGAPMTLSYVSVTENLMQRGFSRGWYAGDSRCEGSGVDTGNECDEYPYFSTLQGGPLRATPPGIGVSLRPISRDPNRWEGSALQAFYNACGLRSGPYPARETFIVAPSPSTPRTIGACQS